MKTKVSSVWSGVWRTFGRLCCPIAIVLGVSVPVQAQTFLTNGLVAYYPFNGNANDASGNGHNGILPATGPHPTTDRSGQPNSAYRFVDAGDYIYLGDGLRSDNITVCVWFRTSTSDNEWSSYRLLMRDRLYGWSISMYGPSSSLPITGPNGAVASHIYRSPSSEDWSFLLTEQAYNDANWHLVVFTYDGIDWCLYMDGSLEVSHHFSSYAGIYCGSGGMAIGQDGDYYTDPAIYFDGDMDDVRIYNRALSANEVQQLYAIDPPPCIPHKATAMATVTNGSVAGATITDSGCGYTNAPVVRISGGGGSGATATATVSNGVVIRVTVTDAGIGYTSEPRIQIASPPFMPWLNIEVSKVKVTFHVVLGKNYVVESSFDLITWTQIGPQFTAIEEVYTQEFDTSVTGRFFRVREVP